MKTNIFLIIIILILACFTVILLYKNSIAPNNYYGELQSIRVENTLLREGFFHSYDFEALTLNPDRPLLNYHGDSSTLKDMVQGSKALVMFMHVPSCEQCNFENLRKIKDLIAKNNNNIFIGLSGIGQRHFKSFVLNNDIKDHAYLLPVDYFEGFHINPIVYFVIFEDSRMRYFFSPANIYPQLTEDYFRKLSDMGVL